LLAVFGIKDVIQSVIQKIQKLNYVKPISYQNNLLIISTPSLLWKLIAEIFIRTISMMSLWTYEWIEISFWKWTCYM